MLYFVAIIRIVQKYIPDPQFQFPTHGLNLKFRFPFVLDENEYREAT